jgi:response regulator RpfG family c-di-GMP phosphodiesterase
MSNGVLIVADKNTLDAAGRLLSQEGYVVYQADNEQTTLDMLRGNDIEVIICDVDHLGAGGSALLAETAILHPHSYRIALVNNTDIGELQTLCNQEKVNCVLYRPLMERCLLSLVRHGIRFCQLLHENRRLEGIAGRQHQKLEEQVQQRTVELQVQNEHLLTLQSRLEQSLRDTVSVLARMLEAYSPNLGIHAKRVAQLARHIGGKLGLDESSLRDVEFASHLHDIGKISRCHRDDRPTIRRSHSRRVDSAVQHSESGYAILSRVSGFEKIALSVRHQNELYDGSGKPDGLKGEDIPLGSRIIAVTNAYDRAVFSSADPTRISRKDGRQVLLDGQGRQFDSLLVRVFLQCLDEAGIEADTDAEVELSPKQITEGMVLSRTLHSIDGVLLLKSGTHLTADLIERIRTFDDTNLLLTGVFVKCRPEGTEIDESKECNGSNGSDKPETLDNTSGVEVEATADILEPPNRFRKRVLIVDDSSLVCSALDRELCREGFEVVSTDNGLAALNLAKQGGFDVVLADLMMPSMSGETLVEQLQRSVPRLPCVILTGNVTRPQVLKLARTPNVASVLIKPWDHKRLVSSISSAIAGKRFVS